jgi:hypothetical protein
MNTDKHRFKIVDEASCLVALMLGALLLLFTGCKQDEPKTYPLDRLTVEYSIDRETIHVGDPVELMVTAYYPANVIFEFPEIGREKDIVLLNRNRENIPREDGLAQTESRYSITSFRLGDHIISTHFPDLVLHVESTLETDASSEIADIKPVHKLPGRVPRWIWIVLGTAMAAFLVGLITSRLWKHRKTILPSAPPIPPHIIAIQALEFLKNKGLLEKGECKPFYTELSLILRTYLEGRFNLNAPDETTEEIVEELSTSPELTGTQRNILQEFMRQADMVKFAKGHPDRTTMEAAFNTTKQFVEETSTKPETGNWKPETP